MDRMTPVVTPEQLRLDGKGTQWGTSSYVKEAKEMKRKSAKNPVKEIKVDAETANRYAQGIDKAKKKQQDKKEKRNKAKEIDKKRKAYEDSKNKKS